MVPEPASFVHSFSSASTLGSAGGGFVTLLTYQSLHYCILGNLLLPGALELNAFNYPWLFQVHYFFFFCISLSTSVQVSGRAVIGQFRFLMLVSPSWMEAHCLCTDLNMLEDIHHQCHMVKDFIRDVLVGHVLKYLPTLH